MLLHTVAYIDGGSGSMLLQAALATVFAASFALKGVFMKAFTAMKSLRHRQTPR